jgi:hypothetical protein
MAVLITPLVGDIVDSPLPQGSVDIPLRPKLVEVASWVIRLAAPARGNVAILRLMTAIAVVRTWCWGWFRIEGD